MRIVFAGTPAFAVPALAALLAAGQRVVGVLTQPDRPAGRGRRLQVSPVKQLALAHGLPVQQPTSLRAAEAEAELAALAPELMVVVAYGLLLPPAVLALPRHGGINIHASLLPRWRGAAPIQRAILAGDAVTGISLMQMQAGLDTGPVLARRETPITATDTTPALHDRLAQLGAEALVALLPRLAAGQVRAQPQDDALATYAAKLDKAEARIDWRAPAVAIDRAVRAYQPWPVAHTACEGTVLRLWRTRVATDHAPAAPGHLQVQADQVRVGTGEGVLELLEVQPAGGRRMAAADWARGRALHEAELG
ncbi:MAG: methionyl-tRNA formyltransferase [Pseudomonadota bacterium]|nr:methionyl-tRNA formyltransferase [Pseudomonadota bacterium]